MGGGSLDQAPKAYPEGSIFASFPHTARAPLRPAPVLGLRAKSADRGKTRGVATVGTSVSLALTGPSADFNVISDVGTIELVRA
jgi:hypothetical protein